MIILKCTLNRYENEELTQLGHVGAYGRALLKPTLNCWVSSKAENLLKGKASIDLHRIICISSETPQTCPRVTSTALHSPEALLLSQRVSSKWPHFISYY